MSVNAEASPRPDPQQQQPRLLYVSHVDTVVRMMLPHLDAARARGFRVEVACCLTRHAQDLQGHADAIHELPFRRSPLDPANLVALQQLVQLMRRGNYTIVHAHTPTGGVIGRLAATIARVPLRVYTPHGFHFHRHGSFSGNLLFRGIETLAGRLWSDGVFTINGEDFDAAKRYGVAREDQIFLTRGVGISTDRFDPATVTAAERQAIRAEMGAENDDVPIITFVGEMIPRKRHQDALTAFKRLQEKRPDAILVFAGDGKRMKELQAEAVKSGMADRVRFLGFRRDIVQLLSATDIFLFPSAQEGLPCSIQEALSMEVPVVATDVRGNRDLVDNSCGFMTALGNTEEMAGRLLELINRGVTGRAEMGRAGREKMTRLYAREICVNQWLEIYEQLLKERGMAMPPLPPVAAIETGAEGEVSVLCR